MNELNERGNAFRAAIAGFIDTRREAKLKGKEDDADSASKYDYTTWLADAARRVAQIQAVTHVLKATHPDARGSSLHAAPCNLPQRAEIGSHLLGADYAEDVVGNAAALDVFKLLKLEIEGKRLLDWMQAGDADLQAALCDDAEQARAWMQAFASLVRADTQPATHPMAKQLYWLVGDTPRDDSHYQLLQPMFSSALAHAVHADIQDARFSDASKAARQARRNHSAGEPYRDYRDLAVRKLGGTKPQNISQLNSERGGVNYLLASLPPPAWKPRVGADLLNCDTVFADRGGAFFYYGEVRSLVRELADFLRTDPGPNQATRERVAAFSKRLVDGLATFGTEAGSRRDAGWTRDANCHLPLCEQLWLDPDRSELPLRDAATDAGGYADDLVFNAAYAQGDWANEVAGRFGRGLNDQLRKRSDKLAALGETEMHHFARQAILDVAWPIPQQRRAKAGAA